MIVSPAGPAAHRAWRGSTAARPALPGGHLGLSWRALDARDVDDVVALLDRSEAVDSSATLTTRAEVEDMLDT
ncbi:MAG: hypothetical protein ACTMKU_09315, partial [Actinomycetaceae bacterium]